MHTGDSDDTGTLFIIEEHLTPDGWQVADTWAELSTITISYMISAVCRAVAGMTLGRINDGQIEDPFTPLVFDTIHLGTADMENVNSSRFLSI